MIEFRHKVVRVATGAGLMTRVHLDGVGVPHHFLWGNKHEGIKHICR